MSAPTHNRAPPANMSAVTHNRAPSQLQNPQYRTGILNDFRNSHLQHTLNPQAHQPMQPLNTQLSHIQQGGSQANAAGPAANSQQARVMASSHAARQGNSQAGIVWTAGATVYSEQARAIATALAARHSRPQAPPQAPQPGRTSSPLDVLTANSRNAHNPSRP
ncbi:transcription factor, partial [Trifolium medium]|nr:transcription factor [Trifolium medium]